MNEAGGAFFTFASEKPALFFCSRNSPEAPSSIRCLCNARFLERDGSLEGVDSSSGVVQLRKLDERALSVFKRPLPPRGMRFFDIGEISADVTSCTSCTPTKSQKHFLRAGTSSGFDG